MKIALIGDIGFFGKYSKEGNSNILDYFASAAKYLSNFDYVIGNLELPLLAEGEAIGAKSASLKSAPQNVELLKYLNINVVTLANNHIFDYGTKGLDSTVALLDDNGIKHFGLHGQDLLLEDINLALHGYCCFSTNPYGLNGHVNKLNIKDVTEKMLHFSEQGYLNLVSVHAGLEHVNYPARHDIEMARQFSEVSEYIYYGHHPHVLQGIESVNNSVLAYSLGNFCFDDVYTSKSTTPLITQNDNNKTSAILELTIKDGKVVDYTTTSIYMAEDSLEIGSLDLEPILGAYSSALMTEKEKYTKFRSGLFADYVSKRKSLRDFNWYIKRLNFNSAIMIAKSKYNHWQHKRNVIRLLHGNSD